MHHFQFPLTGGWWDPAYTPCPQREPYTKCHAFIAGISIPGFPEHVVSVQYATEHRCGVVLRGAGLSDAISGTDPLRDNLPLQVPAGHVLLGSHSDTKALFMNAAECQCP